jgi:hypothetical protein
MKAIKRILASLLCAVICFSVLTGCRSAATRQEQRVIGTCAGYDVLYEELRYLTLTYKQIFESNYGAGIWDDPATAEQYRKELEDTVWRLILNNYAVLAAADQYLPHPNAIENESIQEAVDGMIAEMVESCGGKKEFRQELKRMNATENLLRLTFGVAQLENELMYALSVDWQLFMSDSQKFYNWMQDGNAVYVQHIFIENDPGEDVEANRQLAEDVRIKLLTKESTLAQMVGSAINEDYQNAAPYFVVREVYKPAIEEQVFSLFAPDDVSSVVETETGFYVFVQVEEPEGALAKQLDNLFASYRAAKTEDVVEEFKKDLKLELNEYGKSLDLLTIQ